MPEEQTMIQFLETQIEALTIQQQNRIQELFRIDPILTQIIGAVSAYTSALELAKKQNNTK